MQIYRSRTSELEQKHTLTSSPTNPTRSCRQQEFRRDIKPPPDHRSGSSEGSGSAPSSHALLSGEYLGLDQSEPEGAHAEVTELLRNHPWGLHAGGRKRARWTISVPFPGAVTPVLESRCSGARLVPLASNISQVQRGRRSRSPDQWQLIGILIFHLRGHLTSEQAIKTKCLEP